MFREMRRIKQQLPAETCTEVLGGCTHGVLAVLGDDGYPYAVPLSYVYDGAKMYFHCAKSGHKLDAVEKCDKASFCVVDRDQIVPEKYTTYFRSVIAFGRVRVMENGEEKRAAAAKLAARYAPDSDAEGIAKEIDSTWNRLCVLEFTVEHLTGKQAIELVKESV